jgi:hypothetical protein
MSPRDGNFKESTACFQFTSNSIQLAASFEILKKWNLEQKFPLTYYWLGASTKYPSRMSRGLDNFSRPFASFPRSISNALKFIKFENLEMKQSLPTSSEREECLASFIQQLRNVKNVKDFQALQFNNIRPGGALANSFVYETGRRDFSFENDKFLITLLLDSYLSVYFGVINELQAGINRALIYNGRFLHERAAWDACKTEAIETFIFETTRNRYHLRRNVGFHDRIINQKFMLDLWEEKSKDLSTKELDELGSRYFIDLESKRNQFFTPVKDLTNLLSKSDFFVFFSNSDDEAVGFWDSWTEPFIDQPLLIEKLQVFFEKRQKEHLYIRLHPNLATKSHQERNRWSRLHSTRYSTVIQPGDEFSSYELLKKAKGVISYGSTIGLEAAYHLVPSAILADCWYDELQVADKLTDFQQLFNWIESITVNFNKDTLERRRLRSLVRGLWFELSGNKFENSLMRELSWGAWEVERFGSARLLQPKVFIWRSILINRLKRIFSRLKP